MCLEESEIKGPLCLLIGMEKRRREMGLNMFLMTRVHIDVCVCVCLAKRLAPTFELGWISSPLVFMCVSDVIDELRRVGMSPVKTCCLFRCSQKNVALIIIRAQGSLFLHTVWSSNKPRWMPSEQLTALTLGLCSRDCHCQIPPGHRLSERQARPLPLSACFCVGGVSCVPSAFMCASVFTAA